jgi:hypothetical protein
MRDDPDDSPKFSSAIHLVVFLLWAVVAVLALSQI